MQKLIGYPTVVLMLCILRVSASDRAVFVAQISLILGSLCRAHQELSNGGLRTQIGAPQAVEIGREKPISADDL